MTVGFGGTFFKVLDSQARKTESSLERGLSHADRKVFTATTSAGVGDQSSPTTGGWSCRLQEEMAPLQHEISKGARYRHSRTWICVVPQETPGKAQTRSDRKNSNFDHVQIVAGRLKRPVKRKDDVI